MLPTCSVLCQGTNQGQGGKNITKQVQGPHENFRAELCRHAMNRVAYKVGTLKERLNDGLPWRLLTVFSEKH